jgi:hypothetical protein
MMLANRALPVGLHGIWTRGDADSVQNNTLASYKLRIWPVLRASKKHSLSRAALPYGALIVVAHQPGP